MPRQLKPQRGQNAADCLITAFCTVMNIPVFEAKRFLGHDGMERLWPSMPPPTCYRGFTFPECIMFAYLRGYSCTVHEFEGEYTPYIGVPGKMMRQPDAYRHHVLKTAAGVLVLDNTHAFHAVAFCEGIIYDPANGQYILPAAQFPYVRTCVTLELRDNFGKTDIACCKKIQEELN